MDNNLLEQSKSLQWIWQGTKKRLGDLHYNQLTSILVTLDKQMNGSWFGISNSAWRTAIRQVIKHKYPSKFRSIIQETRINNIKTEIVNTFKQLK